MTGQEKSIPDGKTKVAETPRQEREQGGRPQATSSGDTLINAVKDKAAQKGSVAER